MTLPWDRGLGRGYNLKACLGVFGLRGRVPIAAIQSGEELLS